MFLHVNDLGSAAVFALENWDPNSSQAPISKSGEPLTYLNVGTGLDISIKDLTSKIAEATGYKGHILWDKTKPDGTPKKLLDVNKLSQLGWRYTINLEKGLTSTILDFKQQVKLKQIRL